jgi:pyruvate dehydrogenase E1 component beta subunit
MPERLFTGIPGLRVVAPSDALTASALLQAAIASPDPVLFVEHKMLYPLRWDVPDGLPHPLPLNKGAIARPGTDITIIAWSYMLYQALQAAETLASEDISAEVIDVRSLAPLDIDCILDSVTRTGRVVIAEEGPISGSLAGEIATRIFETAYDYLDAPIKRVASADCPVPAARNLEAAAIPNVASIVAAAQTLVAGVA